MYLDYHLEQLKSEVLVFSTVQGPETVGLPPNIRRQFCWLQGLGHKPRALASTDWTSPPSSTHYLW